MHKNWERTTITEEYAQLNDLGYDLEKKSCKIMARHLKIGDYVCLLGEPDGNIFCVKSFAKSKENSKNGIKKARFMAEPLFSGAEKKMVVIKSDDLVTVAIEPKVYCSEIISLDYDGVLMIEGGNQEDFVEINLLEGRNGIFEELRKFEEDGIDVELDVIYVFGQHFVLGYNG